MRLQHTSNLLEPYSTSKIPSVHAFHSTRPFPPFLSFSPSPTLPSLLSSNPLLKCLPS